MYIHTHTHIHIYLHPFSLYHVPYITFRHSNGIIFKILKYSRYIKTKLYAHVNPLKSSFIASIIKRNVNMFFTVKLKEIIYIVTFDIITRSIIFESFQEK